MAILQMKLKVFYEYELEGRVKAPVVKDAFYYSWVQYSILQDSEEERDGRFANKETNGIMFLNQ